MNRMLVRRGPDGEGLYFDGPVGLAMRRLAIIDLEGGWQPLYNEDRSIVLVANGEVYNFVELAKAMEAQGHRLRTHSDCELPAHLYETFGMDFVHQLRGMYAIAMWDSRKRRLILVRDRMGEKPLFIYERTLPNGGKQLLFASEMKSLLASGLINFDLDEAGVDELMHYQWIHDPDTAIKGIRKLPAGHYLTVDVDTWHIEQKQYWRMEDAPPIHGEPKKVLREVLDDVSRLVIRSDVPVGVALSGGIDSSTIACLSSKHYPGTMEAFSIGWANRPANDERKHARDLAAKLNMPFHEAEIAPEEMADFYHELNVLRDDPIADITGHAYYVLTKLAREKKVPVLLLGQGGDELFWGYPWAKRALAESRYKLKHGRIRRPDIREMLMPRTFDRHGLVEYAFRFGAMTYGWRPLRLPQNSDQHRYVFYDVVDSWQMGRWARPRIFTKQFQEKLGGWDASMPFTFTAGSQMPSVEVLLTAMQCRGYLLENGINQADRLAMASSVEGRLPLVDYKFVEAVIGLQKTRPGEEDLGIKYWLKQAVEDVVPPEVFNRPKRGFNPPVTDWTNALRVRYRSMLETGYLVSSGVLTPEAAMAMSRDTSRLSAWNDLFVKALTLESWSQGMIKIIEQARENRKQERSSMIAAPSTFVQA